MSCHLSFLEFRLSLSLNFLFSLFFCIQIFLFPPYFYLILFVFHLHPFRSFANSNSIQALTSVLDPWSCGANPVSAISSPYGGSLQNLLLCYNYVRQSTDQLVLLLLISLSLSFSLYSILHTLYWSWSMVLLQHFQLVSQFC